MKRTSKYATGAVAALLAVALAGCGGETGTTATDAATASRPPTSSSAPATMSLAERVQVFVESATPLLTDFAENSGQEAEHLERNDVTGALEHIDAMQDDVFALQGLVPPLPELRDHWVNQWDLHERGLALIETGLETYDADTLNKGVDVEYEAMAEAEAFTAHIAEITGTAG